MLQQKQSKNKIALIIVIALTVAWMVMIFVFSGQDGGQSSGLSEAVSRVIAGIFVPDFAKMTSAAQMDILNGMSFFVRKAAHMTEYAVLAVLFSIMAKLIWDAVTLRRISVIEEHSAHMQMNSFEACEHPDKVQKTPAKIFLFLYLLPFIATVLYAISDEVHQLFIAARAGQVTDVLIDAGGAVIGLLILLAVRAIRRKISHKDNQSS